MVTAPQPGPAAKLPAAQCTIAAANIRALRQRNGWTQARLGQLMGWPAASTVCAAEGHRGGRQRRFARWEIDQLAAIFGIPAAQLLSRCVTCGGQPPPGYACLACKAARPERPARPAATSPPLPAEVQREQLGEPPCTLRSPSGQCPASWTQARTITTTPVPTTPSR